MKRLPLRFLSLALLASLAACSESDSDTPADNPDGSVAGASYELSYSFTNLPELGADSIYEGWLIVDGAPVSSGRFSVDENGVPTPATSMISMQDAEAATTFVLTIEPAAGDDPAPADTHVLAGDMSSMTASLTTDHAAALGSDFESASGSYILATPTTGDDTLSEQGIWYLVPGEPMTAGLTLPTLPAGWAYEGWIVDGSGPVSTGRFTATEGADSDKAGASKGPMGDGPPFPGQDYITPASILNDGSHVAVISVEPDPDDSPMPFILKPLVHDPIGSAIEPTLHTMSNNAAATLPSGSVTLAMP